MANCDEYHRQTIRIKKITKQRLNTLIESGRYMTEAELIRHALSIGLDQLEEKK